MATLAMKSLTLTVILEQETDGAYSVYCPAMPGCVSQGDDRQGALANIKEAIELFLDIAGDVEYVTETPAMIAGEIREVLDGRQQDGLSYAGIFLEQVEITCTANVLMD